MGNCPFSVLFNSNWGQKQSFSNKNTTKTAAFDNKGQFDQTDSLNRMQLSITSLEINRLSGPNPLM